jgi:hypothetical protein
VGGQAREGDRQLCAPCRCLTPDASAQVRAIPREILAVPAAIAPQDEIEDRVERIDFDLEVALEVTDRIQKNSTTSSV